MQIRMYGATDVGRVRSNNQDSLYFNQKQGLAIVCDGIGGRKGGELASSLAVDGIRRAIIDCDSLRHEEITNFLSTTVDRVNRGIIERGRAEIDKEGMGTTLNCLLFVGDKVYIAHLGDSRTYLYYQGYMWQLTLDHNLEVYVERGWLPPEALNGKSKSAALVRSLGLSEHCEVDIYEKRVKPGEIFITCSDGLSGMVGDRKIAAIIKENLNRVDQIPSLLIAEANRKGGRDNITVVLSEVKDDR